MELKQAKLVAFGSTRRKNIKAADDRNVQSLLQADTEYVAILEKLGLPRNGYHQYHFG